MQKKGNYVPEDSSELSQGILLAPTTKPTPNKGIQSSIASSHKCQHLGFTVPSMKYLFCQGYFRGHTVISISLENSLPHASHLDRRGFRLIRGSTYQLDSLPTTLHCSPSDSGRSTASHANTLRPVPLMRYVEEPVPIPGVN